MRKKSTSTITNQDESVNEEPTITLSWSGKNSTDGLQKVNISLEEIISLGDSSSKDSKKQIKTSNKLSPYSLIWGDNLLTLNELVKNYENSIDLVYIDPPFYSNNKFSKKIDVDLADGTIETLNIEQYSDRWQEHTYLQFIYERLQILYKLLSQTGTIYVHCDHREVHHIRSILDEIFSSKNFRSMVSWRRQITRGMKSKAKMLPNNTDYILIYTKSDIYTWNYIQVDDYQKLSKTTPILKDEHGNRFTTSHPGTYSNEMLIKLLEQNRIYITHKGEPKIIDGKLTTTKGKIRIKYYVDANQSEAETAKKTFEPTMNNVDDIWTDVPGLAISSKESELYPTQKPEKLLERIILASSNAGDTVLDCFNGSGTTAIVAYKLSRKFIGIDNNYHSINVTKKRIVGIASRRERLSSSIDISEQNQNIIDDKLSIFYSNHYNIFTTQNIAQSAVLSYLKTDIKIKNIAFTNLNNNISSINKLTTQPSNKNTSLTIINSKNIILDKEKDSNLVNIYSDLKDIVKIKSDFQIECNYTKNELTIKSFIPKGSLTIFDLEHLFNINSYKQWIYSIEVDYNHSKEEKFPFAPQIIIYRDELLKENSRKNSDIIIPIPANTNNNNKRIKLVINDILDNRYEYEM